MKTCGRCLESLELSMFSKDRTKKDGLQARCKNCMRKNGKAWSDANKERHLELQRKWYAENRLYHNYLGTARARANPGEHNARIAKYRASKLQATPAWANLEAIKAIYAEAARLGLEVDHVIPLQHDLVCGLHVENNLELLTTFDNRSKGNIYLF